VITLSPLPPCPPPRRKGKARASEAVTPAPQPEHLSTLPWVEKFRPQALTDLVAHEEIISICECLRVQSSCSVFVFSLRVQSFCISPSSGKLACDVIDLKAGRGPMKQLDQPSYAFAQDRCSLARV
jgi:hypothetical protein